MSVSWRDLHASARQAVADAAREGLDARVVARELHLRAHAEPERESAAIDRLAWLLSGRVAQVASAEAHAEVDSAVLAAATSGDLDSVLALAEAAEEADQAEARTLAPAARAQRFYQRALRFWEQGDLLSAVADVTSALEATPDDIEMLSNRGGWLYNLGSPWAAVGDWERAVKLRPEYANGWMKIATVLAEFGQKERARRYLQRAAEVALDDWPYRERVEAQLREWEQG